MNDILIPDRPGSLLSDEHVQWRESIRTVSRHWFVFGLVIVGGFAATVAVILTRPPVYQATARLVVQPNVAHEPFSSQDNSGALMARYADSRGAEAEINASVAMLESRALVRHVLESASSSSSSSKKKKSDPGSLSRAMDAITGLPTTWYQRIHTPPVIDPMDQRVDRALSALSVRALEKSYVIDVKYLSGDPAWAATFVNSLVKEYLSPDSVLLGGEERFSFFHEQRALVEQRLDTARTALRAFRDRDESDLAFEDPAELRSHRGQLQVRRDETSAELAGIDARLVSLAQELAGLSASVNVDPQLESIAAVDQIAARVTELELQRSEVLSRYAATSAAVRDLDAQLGRAKQMLVAETAAAGAKLARSGNAAQDLALERVQARVHRSLLIGTLAALDAEIATYTEKLDRLDKVSAERDRLETELVLAEEAHTTYRKKEEEARFADALHRAGIRNQMVIEHAVVPSVPEPAGAGRTMLLGVLLSMLAAMGLVRLIDRLDSSVKAVAEAEILTGANVIGLVTLDDAIGPASAEHRSRLGNKLHHPAKSIAAFFILAVLFAVYVHTIGRSAAKEDRRTASVGQVARGPLDAGIALAEEIREDAADSLLVEAAAAVEKQDAVVVIEQGTTMDSLLRRVYGVYSADDLERVRRANPWLEDPTQIMAGTTIYLPVAPGVNASVGAGSPN